MLLNTVTRIVYGLFGLLYVLIGAGSMLAPAGWLPQGLVDATLAREFQSPFVEHLVQEFGTVVLALGMIFLWFGARKQRSAIFHWVITLYFSLDALIHWIGPHGPYGDLSRGLINSVPAAIMLLLGLLPLRSARTAAYA
jgi:hypothetical protein